MKISLKIKLMITFFILISLPMGLLGYISYRMSSASIQTAVQQQLKEQTYNTSNLINKTIDSTKHSLEVASLNGDIIKAVENSNTSNLDTASEYIKEVQEKNKDFMEVLIITDAYGKVIVNTQSKENDIDLSDRDYMKQVLSSGKEVVSEVLTSRFTGNPAIFIAYPLKENGKLIGTLVGSIKFDSISSYASQIKVGKSGYAYMIDKNGLIVYHPDSSKILKENANDNAGEDLKVLVQEMKEGKSSEGFYTYGNIYKYVVFQPVGNWVIAVTAQYDEYMSAALSIRNYTIIISLISIIIAMICAYTYSTIGIINPIKKLERLMRSAGEGDLTVKIDIQSKDEIEELGKSFNEMIKHQDKIVRNVTNAAEQLNAASEEMAASSEEISAATEEISATVNQVAQDAEKQNESIVDVSKVLVQLSSLVQLAQSRAKATSSNAANTMSAADLGREKVEETVKAMDIISKGSEETSQALESLSGLSSKVDGIINIINSIAEQTNLLALNAAIEAARAGEHGKGFSVVADEVRKLSEESNDRAREIAVLVSEMVKQTQNAVIAMERSKSEVNNGVKIVSETDKAFVDIINAIENIVKHVTEILDITGDEVASSDKVIGLINDIATVTESNASNSENVSSAAEEQASAINNLTATAQETSAMAEELTKLVERFKI
ncbi:methyl-accepting chemotaxis protein [Clostridium beijerinckii]|uniref:Methyl-accepting chemotaxis protein n=1 Tax=Clostridium beijerinckii TaxID=1520 RepID=A0AAX0B3T2_CLOBE|nr:methyl-accepting chemotaxis protein [Clostridium beijerinckii]MBA8937623.1 methyl-accepting chemotaxis protein [Clostridium beijerinckii]NRT33005.1 methyl-accepting chemotaxis protein [Clostridium beijerinckii]NRT47570.1 methyl-accepting chemotaxis protein [Clostridium beijerinckii]NRT89691.1 methyl-accepting chemotaxis protein [Clostridium beijerinckii]NRU41285.1 methyl-accepting chemotaxis protein [Clostridium beijerinckii]